MSSTKRLLESIAERYCSCDGRITSYNVCYTKLLRVYSGPIELDGRSLLYSIVFDVTERRKLESTIEQEQRFLATVINSFGDGMMVINRDYTISMMNDAVSSNIDISRLADPEHPKCYEVSHQRSTPCDGLEHPCPLAQVTESRGRVNVLHRHESYNFV